MTDLNIVALVSVGAHPTSGRSRRAEQDARAVELGLRLAGQNLQLLHAGDPQAEALRGTALTVPRSALPALPEGEYYHADLVGLPCTSSTGETLGEIIAVENFGAGDIIEVQRPSIEGKPGKRFMAPMYVVLLSEDGAVIDAAFTE